MLYMATGKPAHLDCKFLSDVSVVNSPIVVELLVITVLFCVVLPAGSTTQNKTASYFFPKYQPSYIFPNVPTFLHFSLSTKLPTFFPKYQLSYIFP